MPPPKSSTSKSKKSKIEVQQELENIISETTKEKEATNPKLTELTRMKEAEVREAVKDVSVDGVLRSVAALGSEVNRILSDLSSKMVKEVQELATIREAVTLDTQELNRLHKIDVASTAIDLLIQDYEQKKISLEQEISTGRDEWEKEQAERQREQNELERKNKEKQETLEKRRKLR